MYVDLVQYLHFFVIVVAGLSVISHYIRCFNAIPSLIVLDLAFQEVLPPIQDENGDVNEWVEKGSKCFAKWMHALVLMWPNGYSISTWSKHTPFKCKQKNQGIHYLSWGA